MRILVAEPIADKGIALLQAEHAVTVRAVSAAELLEIIPEYDAVITRSASQITAEVVAKGTNLKVVGRAGVGVDNIDVGACTDRGIVVVNVPGANTISTAEHTLALMLAVVRHIPQAMATLKAGKWDKKSYTGMELYDKTLGVIGFGRIGSEVAARARAFGMHVLTHDPYANPQRAEALGVEIVDFPRLLQESDIITIHAAKTQETAHLIGAKEIATMKDGARIVNCARGGMVNEDDLYAALQSGKLAGAALDVYTTEPMTQHKLFELPNVVFTPHLAASTAEAQEANGVMIAQLVLKVLRGELVPDAVNLPAVPPDAAQSIVRHLPLAEALGTFLAQAFAGHVEELQVTYHGQLANEPTVLVTNTAVKGFLAPRADEAVNYINAPTVAARHGVQVRESKAVDARGPSIISVQARLVGGRLREVSGTLGMDSHIRLVSVNGRPLDMIPARNMLVTLHHDRPGMLGQFGTILGQHKVNIAGLSLGRQSKAGEAVAIFLVDDVPPAKALDAIRAVDGMIDARAVAIPFLKNGI